MYDYCKLPNGLIIIGEKLPHFRSVSVGVWIAAGSQHETWQENGMSHFLEHMSFKGTERRSARRIAEEMDAVGGHLNAFTAKECTCFYAKVIDEHMALAFDMLSDIVLNSVLDPSELDKEKGVILEEISMVEDEPEDLVHELIMSAHYGNQSIARPILGSVDSVQAIDRTAMASYRGCMYRPDRSVIAVAGNYEWDVLVDMAGRSFGDWRADAPPVADFASQAAVPTLIRREKEIEQLHICLSFPGYPQGSDSVYPMSIFSNIFGGAMSSRLFQKIREDHGMAYSVYSYPVFYADTGLLAVYAGTSTAHATKVVDMIRAEMDSLIECGVTRDEFNQTRAQFKGNYVLGQESASARMNALGRRMLLMGDTQTEDDVLRKIDAIEYDMVNVIIRETLSAKTAGALVGRCANSQDMSCIIR